MRPKSEKESTDETGKTNITEFKEKQCEPKRVYIIQLYKGGWGWGGWPVIVPCSEAEGCLWYKPLQILFLYCL